MQPLNTHTQPGTAFDLSYLTVQNPNPSSACACTRVRGKLHVLHKLKCNLSQMHFWNNPWGETINTENNVFNSTTKLVVCSVKGGAFRTKASVSNTAILPFRNSDNCRKTTKAFWLISPPPYPLLWQHRVLSSCLKRPSFKRCLDLNTWHNFTIWDKISQAGEKQSQTLHKIPQKWAKTTPGLSYNQIV